MRSWTVSVFVLTLSSIKVAISYLRALICWSIDGTEGAGSSSVQDTLDNR